MVDATPRKLHEVVAERVKRYREAAGMRQEDLAACTAELGYPLNRVSLARIEAGGTRAENLSLADLLVLALALDVAPAQLFLPVGDDEWVTFTSKVNVHPHLALEWLAGDDEGSGVARDSVRWDRNTWPLKMFRGLRERQQVAHRASVALATAVAMEADGPVIVNFSESHAGSPAIDEGQQMFDRALLRVDEHLSYMRDAGLSVPDLATEWTARLAWLRAREGRHGDG